MKKESMMLSGKCGNHMCWRFEEDTLYITGTGRLRPGSWEPLIPQISKVMIDSGCTSIANYVFMRHKNLREIHLPDTLHTIGMLAFYECTSLEEITLPDSMIGIGKMAFYRCSSLKKLQLPRKLSEISSHVCQECCSLAEVEICGKVKHIGNGAFSQCCELKSIQLPDCIKEIGEEAFCNCNHLERIHLPEGLEKIGKLAFMNCNTLAAIEIPLSVTEIGSSAFFSCSGMTGEDSVAYDKDKRWLLSYTGHKETSIAIHPGVKTICASAFSGKSNLTEVIIPEGVETIGKNAFYGCVNLKEISIPQSVKRICSGAFRFCRGLEGSDGAAYDRDRNWLLWGNCEKTTSIRIPYGVKKVSDSAFYHHSIEEGYRTHDLETVWVPNSATQIGKKAFRAVPNVKYYGSAQEEDDSAAKNRF